MSNLIDFFELNPGILLALFNILPSKVKGGKDFAGAIHFKRGRRYPKQVDFRKSLSLSSLS